MSRTNKLLEFLETASTAELSQCARAADTTVTYLEHLAKQYGGGRKPNVTLALGIDTATREIRKANRGRTPHVTVQDIGAICGWEPAIAHKE